MALVVAATLGCAGAAPPAVSQPAPAPTPLTPDPRSERRTAAPETSRVSDKALFNHAGAKGPAPGSLADDDKGSPNGTGEDPGLPATPPEGEIWAVLNANSHGLQDCVGDAWRRGERLSGTMEVELTISPRGRVKSTRISSSRFKGSLVGSCAAGRIADWHFPKWRGTKPVVVVLPWVVQAVR